MASLLRPFSLPSELLCTKAVIVTFACVLFILTYYMHTRRQDNKQQKQIGYSIFYLKCTEYESMKPQKYVKSCVLTWNIGVFKNCFMFLITKQHESSGWVCYGMNKCVLWNVQIIIKPKSTKTLSIKSRLNNVQKLFCGWEAHGQKSQLLSFMNVMKGWLWTFSKWKTLLECFFSWYMCMTLLFCDYEKEVGMKLVLYVCSWNLWSAYYRKKSSLKQHYENSGTFSVAHGHEKLGNSKFYIQIFT